MKSEQFNLIMALMWAIIIGGLMSFAMPLGKPQLIVPASFASMAFLYLCEKKWREGLRMKGLIRLLRRLPE
jgi:uncharacterized membrane protein